MPIKINKTYLPFLILILVTVGLFFYDPPHSICTNQMQSYRQAMIGKLYGRRVGKNIIPAKINEASLACSKGKSAGSCLDFINIIENAIDNTNQFEDECIQGLKDEKAIYVNSKRFFQMIALIAWGEKTPQDKRDNWLSISNINVFCKNKLFLTKMLGVEEFENLQESTLGLFPFEIVQYELKDDREVNLSNRAVLKMSKEEVLSKSILSYPCQNR